MLKTVLVDDERPALKALEHLLSQYPNVEITGSFTDIEKAWKLIKNGNIQLLFLDIDMPKQNGIEIAKEIQRQNSNIEIVFVTAYQQFALDAFEVKAIDYVMKPVSKKRLDNTIERLARNSQAINGLAVGQSQTDFLNQLLTKTNIDQEAAFLQAAELGINFAKSFSLYFLLPIAGNKQARISFINKLVSKPGFMAWETPHGIGILDYTITAANNAKALELANAETIKTIAAGYFPETKVILGIAEYNPDLESFADRYVQARNTAVIAARMVAHSAVYHFLDICFLPVLGQYINNHNRDALIDRTIGKILEYDRLNSTDLFPTMEQFLFNNSLQEAANTLFVHYKTIVFRKQSIEKVLGISLNSFSGRTMLGVALTIYYLENIPPLSDD